MISILLFLLLLFNDASFLKHLYVLFGVDMARIMCGGCRTLLMYNQGASNVRCSCCHTINIVRPGLSLSLSHQLILYSSQKFFACYAICVLNIVLVLWVQWMTWQQRKSTVAIVVLCLCIPMAHHLSSVQCAIILQILGYVAISL
jgi:LSD1 subclass zinc finger protein